MSELLEAALRYRPRAVPLHPRSKRPFGNGWTTRTWTVDELRRHFDERPDANVGIRTGDRLAVLDIDPRAVGDENLAELEDTYGGLPKTPTVHTGGGGQHYYLRAPAGALASRTIAPGVELKADGRQVVAPPSVHPDGRLYAWDPRRPYEPGAIAPAPRWVLELGSRPTPVPAAARDVERVSDNPLLAIPAREYVPELTGNPVNRFGYSKCPFHEPSEENPETLSVNGPRPALWRCWSDRCQRAGDIYTLTGLLFGIEPPLTGIKMPFVDEQLWQFYERLRGIEPGWGNG